MSVTDCNPNPELASILRTSTVSPAERVRGALLLRGQSMSDLARALGRSRGHLSVVVNDRRVSEALKRDIADYLGVSTTDIWPEAGGAEEAA